MMRSDAACILRFSCASGITLCITEITVHFTTHRTHDLLLSLPDCFSYSCGHPDETGVLSEEILDSKQTGTNALTQILHVKCRITACKLNIKTVTNVVYVCLCLNFEKIFHI